jgi:hypothetical protein
LLTKVADKEKAAIPSPYQKKKCPDEVIIDKENSKAKSLKA